MLGGCFMVNTVSSSTSVITQQAFVSQQVTSSTADRNLPENGLATVAQQPKTYSTANTALQYGLAKNQAQHSQNMIDAYTQDSNEESSELITDLSLTDLYKRAYVLEHGDFPADVDDEKLPKSGDYMTIQPVRSYPINAYENNQPKVNSLYQTQV